MFERNLTDLDELLLSVRDRNSREYISEAIANYRARSYRSAISATWVAVAYDIISKIRELAFHGDAAAKKFVNDLDAAIHFKQSDYSEATKRLQFIENGLLDVATRDHEFLSSQELIDLKRLRDDRHQCAHPAFTSEDVLFQPSPELVRTHIAHAVLYLLRHPPVQGKTALSRLKNDLLQPSFPTSQPDVSEFMEDRYLNHVKDALLDNFITVFLKVLIKQSEADLVGKEDLVLKCLVAVQLRHPHRYEQRISAVLPNLADGADDAELTRVIRLFRADRRCWIWLTKPSRIRIAQMAKGYAYNDKDVDSVIGCLEIDELRPLLLSRITNFETKDKLAIYSTHYRSEFIDDAISLYSKASNFRSAESLCQSIILPLASAFRPDHIADILDAAAANGQIHSASGTPELLKELFEKTKDLHDQTKSAWQKFLAKMSEKKEPDDYYAYPGLRYEMTTAGMWPA
jgi:hypothetical protein